MLRLKSVLLLIAAWREIFCHEVVVLQSRFSMEDLATFKHWMTEHHRTYSSEAEHEYRLKNFVNNLQTIKRHNAEDHSWQMGLNPFSDMTFDEFKAQYLGVGQNCSATNTKKIFSTHTPPTSKDWRKEGFVSPVKNQGHCGSCWTFSTTGCLESVTAIHSDGHRMDVLSEQQLVDCAGAFQDFGCNGGLPSHAFEYIKYNGGIMSERAYPYKGKNGHCQYDKGKAVAFVQDIVNITKDDEDAIMDAVGNKNPVSIAFDVTADFMHYKSGVYSSTKCGKNPSQVNHAVLAVGYNTRPEKDYSKPYWIIKNSWGSSWGMNGYFYIEYGANMCGLATCASYPIVPRHEGNLKQNLL